MSDSTIRVSPEALEAGAPRARTASPMATGLIVAVTVAGAAVIVAQIPHAVQWRQTQLAAAGAICLATIATELFPLHLRHTTETATFSVTDVVWTAALMLAAPSVLLLALAGGVLLSQAIRRMSVRKVAFNVGQFVVAMWVAALVFHAIPHGGPTDPATWAAAAAAMALNFVVNEALVVLVISLMERERLGAVLGSSFGMDVLPAAGNIAIGIIAAAMWDLSPIGILVAAMPVLLSYLAYAGTLQTRRERDRMRGLYRAGQVLLERLETAGDFSAFLELVARMMDAAAAEIVILREGIATIHGPTGTESSEAAAPGAAIASDFHGEHADASGWTVPIGAPGPTIGSLAVFRRAPLSPAERSLLEALAAQVYVKLRHSSVFAQSVAREQELARILSSTSDGIFVIGRDGRIRSWSPAMERMTGTPAEAAVDRPLWRVLVAPGDEGEAWRRFRDLRSSPVGGIETGAFVRDDGTVGWLRFSSGALRSHDGTPAGVVVVARDVSADIQAEQAKANFIAAISHELRTPLTPLKGYLSLFASGQIASGPEAGETLQTMLRQADRLEHLINDLIDASQMDGGQSMIRREKADVVELVAQVVDETERELGARTVFEPGGEPVAVVADPLRVKQVLHNLVSNAVKYSPADCPIRVEAGVDGGMCVVSVTDIGSGIPVDEQSRIFERFYKVDNGSTRTTGGVGLGLYIAKELVESMSGRLWVRSEPGCGSTFSFSLPLATEDEQASAPEARIA